ncbi:exodeoxyribonuclease VII small subunit [Edaphobacillus lindanitolerans]|uniref:Exodeoxyribonuclease 7 small subunit n=1 Tax=Edaphobacillus lindanitolerans TaxID=550447 RepID=A0A1U7PJH5_9BACI|nr:exodeoxyribonuclease VII small subunit [Edaphobacillus lindanitolerans]SIT81680.1 Exodeoxyribonuclease VII small subunit [Edaphobacillus lindanitolerans]
MKETKQEIKFEEAISRLEEIVRRLESGDVPLEDAISLYKKGMELSAVCHGKLQSAEKQLVTLIGEDGSQAPFNPANGGMRDE